MDFVVGNVFSFSFVVDGNQLEFSSRCIGIDEERNHPCSSAFTFPFRCDGHAHFSHSSSQFDALSWVLVERGDQGAEVVFHRSIPLGEFLERSVKLAGGGDVTAHPANLLRGGKPICLRGVASIPSPPDQCYAVFPLCSCLPPPVLRGCQFGSIR